MNDEPIELSEQLPAPVSPHWDELRALMPVTKQWAYFDHAAVAPLPQPSLDAISEWATDVAENGAVNWSRWGKQIEEGRRICAKLIGAKSTEIALIRNTTEGINLIAEGIPWEAGDEVIVPDAEFPSNLYPWWNLKSRGVITRTISTTNEQWSLDDLERLINKRTRLIALSWVGYLTGWRNNLNEVIDLAHANNCKVFVDAIQGIGILPLNVKETPVDFLAADGHKWQLGPEGAGLLYIRQEHLDWLRPLNVGWHSVQHAGNFQNHDFTLKESAARYEGGTWNMPGFLGYTASLRLLDQFGISAISERIPVLIAALVELITNLGGEIVSSLEPEHQSGILAVNFPGKNSRDIQKKCLEAGVVLNCRGGNLRLSPHAYLNEADLKKLGDALKTIVHD